MKILLVYPETPATFWSFHNALKFVSKKSSQIPLGLLTIAAFLPEEWDVKLIDMNIQKLKDNDIRRADYIFLSGMNIHLNSFKGIIKRCTQWEKPIIAGGPFVTSNHRDLLGIDYFIIGEAEEIMPELVEDLKQKRLKPIYRAGQYPDLSLTPIPRWDLLNMKKYAGVNVQYSRGCPYDCEFCSITQLNGRYPRTKSQTQFIAELQSLYEIGWRGSVFIVDDNFIGNKRKLKTDILPALKEWQIQHDFPFNFMTEVSINLADDDELVKAMVDAGFRMTFVGIETPNDESLNECGKKQNQSRDLISSVKKLQRHGLIVTGGFIVGFDNDPQSIFESQIRFIQKSGIVTAMVGLLNAPVGTKLFKRLESENRLLNIMSGDNMDGSMNFIPKMKYQNLIRGYKKILTTIYSQESYYQRLVTFLKEYKLPGGKSPKVTWTEIRALFRSIWKLGFLEKGKRYYWKLFFYSLFNFPKKFPVAITLAVYGFHFRRVVAQV